MSEALVETPGTIQPVVKLAAPVIAEQFLAMLVGFSDRALTGHYLETPHLAAITLLAYLLWLLYGTFSIVGSGATALVARAVGARDYRFARWVTAQAFVVGAAVAGIVVTAGYTFGDTVIAALRLEGAAAVHAATYLHLVLPAVPFLMLSAVGVACLRAAGDMISGLIVMAVVNVVNLSICWLLVLGPGPIPQLGWKGIALGTATGYVVGGLLVLAMLAAGRSGLKLQLRRLRPRWSIIRRLLRIGIPGGADTLSVIGCQLWFMAIINQLGDAATAAHGVALSIESFAFLPGPAFQMAAATLAGQYLGAGELHRASRMVWTACGLGVALMALGGVGLYTQAHRLAPLFVRAEQAHVAELATPLVQTVSVAMPALAVTMILSGALRGAGDTRWPLLFSLVGFLGVRIPAAYLLALDEVRVPLFGWRIEGWNLGVLGTWYAMVADLGVRAALVFVRFARGRWRFVEV